MKRFFTYFFRTILIFMVVILLLPVLLYIPVVQRVIRDKALEYVHKQSAMQMEIGNFSLKFPLVVEVEDFLMRKADADTLVYAEYAFLDIGLKGVLRQELRDTDIGLRRVKVGVADAETGLSLDVGLEALELHINRIGIRDHKIETGSLYLYGGAVHLKIGEMQDVEPESVVSEPFRWIVEAKRVEMEQVNFCMNSASISYLRAGVESGTVVNGRVDIGRQTVAVDSVDLSGGAYRMAMSQLDSQPEKTPEKERMNSISVDTTAGWRVSAASVAVDNYTFFMDVPSNGFEMNLSDIGIRLSDVYNRGHEVKAKLEDLYLVRREGGEIAEMRADVALEHERSEIGHVLLRTPASTIRLHAYAKGDLGEMISRNPLHLKLDATLGMEDVGIFWRDLPEELYREKIELSTELSYQTGKADIKNIRIGVPGSIVLEGRGSASSLDKLTSVSGNLYLRGEIVNEDFMEQLTGMPLGDLPLNFILNADADAGYLISSLNLSTESGAAYLSGHVDIPRENYRFLLQGSTFPLHALLPSAGLGAFSGEFTVAGEHLDIDRMHSRLTGHIEALEYNAYSYGEIDIFAEMHRMQLTGRINSNDPNLLLNLKYALNTSDDTYNASVKGEVRRADLQQLHFSDKEYAASLDFDITASSAPEQSYGLHASLNRVKIDSSDLGMLDLFFEGSGRETVLDVRSGDFKLAFKGMDAPGGLLTKFSEAVELVKKQLGEQSLDVEEITSVLPEMKLQADGSTDNIMGRFLQLRDIYFKKISLNAEVSQAEGLHFDTRVNHPVVGHVLLDSLCIRMDGKQRLLNYDIALLGSQGIVKDIQTVRLFGFWDKNRLNNVLHQTDCQGVTDVEIGMNVLWQDSSFVCNILPDRLILGADLWEINPGNKVILHDDWRVEADLLMTHEEKLFAVRSARGEEELYDSLYMNVRGIDLEGVSGLLPFVPAISGILHMDVLFSPQNADVIATGQMQIEEFCYEEQRVGNVGMHMRYDGYENLSRHEIGLNLQLDDREVVKGGGTFSTTPHASAVADLNVEFPAFPLRIVNVFIPKDLIRLNGELSGNMQLKGAVDAPDIEGNLAFQQGEMDVVMLGTAFEIDSPPLSIRSGVLEFKDFCVIAPNKSKMQVNGEIRLTPFSDVYTNLKINARNFQLVDVRQNPISLVYGKAFADVRMDAGGAFNKLKLTGNVNLLDNTELVYVLRDVAPELKDRSEDVVQFVSFADTSDVNAFVLRKMEDTGGFVMQLIVNIADAVGMRINLSEDGNNMVAVKGGGNLALAMQPESGLSLVGKYTLSGGTVRYGIPIVGEKTFNIQPGSFAEWTGAPADPLLNISASETMRVNVTDGNRVVNFDAIIRIQNSLWDLDVSFDLNAPNDQEIQSQLLTYNAEERTREALNLMIYATYSGSGGAAATSAAGNNALNNFIEKELNQWTRKYFKNSELKFGIDSYNQKGQKGQEVRRTDYSYQFSKQLFDDKVNFKIGGRISSDDDPESGVKQNLVDDITIEYFFSNNRNWLAKVFRHTNYEVLEGDVTQTGGGVVWRKSYRKLKDIFVRKKGKSEIHLNP